MTTRPLGRTGLQVSPFSLGSMEFGGQVDESTAADLVAAALDAGINAIDTANVYTGGRSEELVGRLIAPHRDRLLIATKFGVPTDADDPNSGGTSRRR